VGNELLKTLILKKCVMNVIENTEKNGIENTKEISENSKIA